MTVFSEHQSAEHPMTQRHHPNESMRDAIRRRFRHTTPIVFSIALASVMSACVGHTAKSNASAWSDARQLVLVTTADWDVNQGELRTFTRTSDGWRATREVVPVTIGRAGSAWGLGLHAAQPGPQKREGDGRSPAGAFSLGTAFGYADGVETGLRYAAMRESDWCVDVVASPLYNRIVDTADVGQAAVAGASEPMRRDLHLQGDQRYKLGFVIEHNAQARPGAGSCIFSHLWKAPGEATTGCTAMAEPAMRALLAWLDRRQRPVFVLLPKAEYARLKTSWRLPDIDL